MVGVKPILISVILFFFACKAKEDKRRVNMNVIDTVRGYDPLFNGTSLDTIVDNECNCHFFFNRTIYLKVEEREVNDTIIQNDFHIIEPGNVGHYYILTFYRSNDKDN